MAQTDDLMASASAGGVGERLRRAREAAGLSLADISARTRIAERHLAALEEGRFEALASSTYAIGFARAYARNVGLDEREIAGAVRAEIASRGEPERQRPPTFEPGDPARVPGPRLAWVAAVAAVLFGIAVFVFWRSYLSPSAALSDLVPDVAVTPSASLSAVASGRAQAPAPATGSVVFTALEPGIWVKFYDTAGRQLMQKQMAQGENFTVPADARAPMVWTGRPDALAITVGGQPVPPLATQQKIVRNVPVSAAALLARGAPGAGASAARAR